MNVFLGEAKIINLQSRPFFLFGPGRAKRGQPNGGLYLGVRAFVRSVSHVKVLVASLFGRLAIEYCVARCLQGLITPQIRGVLWRFVTNSARGRPAIVLP